MNSSSSLLFSIASIPFLLIGVIGNVLVIRIVHKTPDMHSVTNYLLANLAVSDVMTILTLWPWKVCSTNGLVKEMKNYCWISVFLRINVVVSSVTLTVLAVERYHALLKPLRSGLRLTSDKVKKNYRSYLDLWCVNFLAKCFLKVQSKRNTILRNNE